MIKNIKNILISVILFAIIFGGCNNNSIEEDSKQNNELINSNSMKSSFTINSEGIAAERVKEVDSLLKLIKQHYNLSEIKKLDSICSTADGDLSEYFWEISVMLFDEYPKEFIKYLLEYPKCCLRKRLVEGIGINISMYETEDRANELLAEQEKMINKLKNASLSKKELKFIQDLFREINSNLFD